MVFSHLLPLFLPISSGYFPLHSFLFIVLFFQLLGNNFLLSMDIPFSDFPTLYLTFYCLLLLPFLTSLLHILSLIQFLVSFSYVTSSSHFLNLLLHLPSLHLSFFFPYITSSSRYLNFLLLLLALYLSFVPFPSMIS